MPNDPNEKELTRFGFTGRLRTGLITAIIAIQFSAIVYMWQHIEGLNEKLLDKQDELYQMVLEDMRKRIEPVSTRMETTVERLDSTRVAVDSLAQRANSILDKKEVR